MGQYGREALTAAMWWANQLRHTTTGVESRREALDGAIARSQDSSQASESQIAAFEAALAKRIEEELEACRQFNIVVDYDPPQILIDAASEAGIGLWHQLGLKKVTGIAPGYVDASGGDGQKFVELRLVDKETIVAESAADWWGRWLLEHGVGSEGIVHFVQHLCDLIVREGSEVLISSDDPNNLLLTAANEAEVYTDFPDEYNMLISDGKVEVCISGGSSEEVSLNTEPW